MFRFADKGEVLWPVPLRQSDDSGEVQDVTVRVRYRLLPRKVLRARERLALSRLNVQAVREATTTEALAELLDEVTAREEADEALLLQHVTGWLAEDFCDADGQPVAFAPERLQAMLEFDAFFKPLMAGLHAASREGPAKNSKPGPGGTPALAQA